MKNMKGNINDHIERILYNWYGKSLPDTAYRDLLYTFFTSDEINELFGKKSYRPRYRDVSYTTKYDYIDDEYLFNLTQPLYLCQKYRGKDYFQYLNGLACEIVEYKALDEIKAELRQTIYDRYKKDKNFKKRVDFGLQNHLVKSNRPREYLDHKFIDRTVDLAKEYLNPDGSRESWQELTAYILAKLGIFGNIPCVCPEDEDNGRLFKKRHRQSCMEVNCLEERFKLIPPNMMCKGLQASDIALCNSCTRERSCPSFRPCPTGLKRYKTYFERRTPQDRRAFCSTKEFIDILKYIRWFDKDPTCPKCEHNRAWALGSADSSRYQCASCHYKFSVITGTIFKGRTELDKWLIAIAAFNKDPEYTATQLQTQIQVTYKTAWKMLDRVKKTVGNDYAAEKIEHPDKCKKSIQKELSRLNKYLSRLQMEVHRYGIEFSIPVPPLP